MLLLLNRSVTGFAFAFEGAFIWIAPQLDGP